MLESLFLLNTGFCRHPECTVIRGGGIKPITFASTVIVFVHRTQGVILLDTGYSKRFLTATRRGLPKLYALMTPLTHDDSEAVVNQLAKLGISANDVRTIVLSHFHADHIGGVSDFPNAQFVYKDEAWQLLDRMGPVRRIIRGFLPDLLPTDFRARSRPLTTAQQIHGLLPYSQFPSGYDICGDGSLLAVDLPGHAAGQMGLVAEFGGVSYFFVSDAAWVIRNITELQPPSWMATNILMDSAQRFNETLHRLHALGLAQPALKLLPCHCPTILQNVPAVDTISAESLARFIR